MTTFDELVKQVKDNLLAFSKNQESITYLTADMLATDTTFLVDTETGDAITNGIAEIDDEIILIKKWDPTTGIVTVMANLNGRGASGTTPASHTTNTIVTCDPSYTRIRVKEAINSTINACYPDLWVFGSYEFNKLAAKFEYQLPADVEDVYKVTADTIGPSKIWFPAQRWRFNFSGSLNPLEGTTTGKSLQIFDNIVPGRLVRVVYRKKPNILINNSDDFETTTGLPERVTDMIVYGATARLLSPNEAGRLQQVAIEQTERSPLVPPGAATNAANQYWTLYYRRLQEERDRMLDLFEQYQSFLT